MNFERHPLDAYPGGLLSLPDPAAIAHVQVTESNVLDAIRLFPTSNDGGGGDEFRPGYLLKLVNHRETSVASG